MTSTVTAPGAVSVSTLREWQAAGPVSLLDVRTPAEHETAAIPGAVNLPLAELRRNAAGVGAGLGSERVVLICQSGPRAEEAGRLLAGHGAQPVVLTGGMQAWTAADGETRTGRQTWAMERQVRLTAGLLVLTGIGASLRWPRARFLSGAIGAGLTFSAVTDTCTMARLLSLLPYNKGTAPAVDVDAAVRRLRTG